ncbi:MAG TPA: PAS domain-containing protein [Pyrinomonadaceae bacterium]|nr:PAS domain-containing protein [Pyrinomonadaceae bacterium]
MTELPPPIREFIDALTDDLLAPAYLLVSDDGGLSVWGGALDSYGISGLAEGMKVADEFVFLAGVLPVDAGGVFLPNVQTRDQVFADIYFFHRSQGTWILFLDATADVKKRQSLQQRTYDVSLRAAELEHEGRTLYDVNSMLEQRVREQTSELSQTVVRLQQELAESRKTQRALTSSELRFRSVYDCSFIGIVFWDAGGKVTDANDAFLGFVGYSRDDLAHGLLQWNQLSPNEERTPVDTTADTRQRNARDFIRKDGTRTTLLFSANPYKGAAANNVGFATKAAN